MKRSLDALKASFTQKTGGGDPSWKLFYPFWKMEEGATAVVRFLPDLDEENPLGFLVENLNHELIVNGEKKKVPCLSMYGESCPVCDLARKYYDEENEAMGKKYYKKKGYIGQVIVIESPIEHDQSQLVKLVEFGPQVFKQIQAAFQSGDLEEAPFELKGGYNFRFRKTKTGSGQNSYTTSNFAPKQTDLDDSIIERIELYDLKTFRTKQIDRATLEAMLIADQTGKAFKAEDEDEEEAAPAQVLAAVAAVKTEEAPAATAPVAAAEPTKSTSSVLEQLRARAKAAQAAK
jgi:hypothetical protein